MYVNSIADNPQHTIYIYSAKQCFVQKHNKMSQVKVKKGTLFKCQWEYLALLC